MEIPVKSKQKSTHHNDNSNNNNPKTGYFKLHQGFVFLQAIWHK